LLKNITRCAKKWNRLTINGKKPKIFKSQKKQKVLRQTRFF